MPISALGHGDLEDAWEGDWLVASPIYWQASHNDAMIVASGEALDLSEEESRCWFDAWALSLPADAFQLHYHDAYTWLIQAREAPPIHALPVQALLQQPMMSHLKALDATLFWSRVLTENQMLFSAHALNQAREGRYPINGVWIWARGPLKAPVFRTIVGNFGLKLKMVLTRLWRSLIEH